ncbi:MAG: hypothetical protein IJ993_04985, partial [Akkermansia sp.]|nr:hypothetical protein [Akkermansia sp.]
MKKKPSTAKTITIHVYGSCCEDMRDMDYVITTVELAKWAKEQNIDLNTLEDMPFDKFMGEAS